MLDPVDVLIVGGGPGGLFMAARLAGRGVRTVVCEEHVRVGDPVHCTGVLSSDSFSRFDLPLTATLNHLTEVRFVSPGGIPVDYSTPSPIATVIDRPAFDRALADRALAAGAEIRSGARVIALDADAAGVRATVGGEVVQARLAVLACGAQYAFQQRFGFGLPSTYLHTAQRELPADVMPSVELHFGRDVAPGGFAWAVPVVRPEGFFVRIGVMTARDAPGCYRRMLERVGDRWGVSDRELPPRLKILPLGAIDRTYADRLLAIGDAAGLVKPTTGGGIHYSIVSASIAADVALEALASDRLSAASLAPYEQRWRAELEDEFVAQQALRDVATDLSDQAIDSFFELAHTDGIMPIVRATARFNEHRPLIRALFKHPPARRILFKSIVG
ncbi:MAG TPA: NAD(P)/FAD-dependent oxidoreductase [Vicinamibacterales bacterium]|jgi:digeranylgeranylglycerophospholipid reductase|nr:NAD(P)/FAD-dependent oxidoreductase [Vicinamibacterales bacterium]